MSEYERSKKVFDPFPSHPENSLLVALAAAVFSEITRGLRSWPYVTPKVFHELSFIIFTSL